MPHEPAKNPSPSSTPTSPGDEALPVLERQESETEGVDEDSRPALKFQKIARVFKDPIGFTDHRQLDETPKNLDGAAPWKRPETPPRRFDKRKQMREERANVKPGDKEFYRFARLFFSESTATFADVVTGIAQTAPVGRVLSMSHKDATKHGKFRRAFVILFDHEAAPLDLVRLARQGTFKVRGATPHVAVWREHRFKGNDHDKFSSRVMVLRGRADVEDFSEEGIRGLIRRSDLAERALGSMGLDSEPVVTTDGEDGMRRIEWRFFDNHKQVRPLSMILRRHFGVQVAIVPGRDPCWDAALYPVTRSHEGDGRAPKAFTLSGPVRPTRRQTLPRVTQPKETQKLPTSDCCSSETDLDSRLMQLLKRAAIARAAARRDQAGDLNKNPADEAEIESSERLDGQDTVRAQDSLRAWGLASPKRLDKEDQKRVARWGRHLKRKRRPGGASTS